MITKEQKVRLAVFLVVSLVLLTAISAIFILPKLKDEGDVYYIDFKEMSVNGVNAGAGVKYMGVKIGKVARIEVNPEDLRSVLVYIKIKRGFPVKKDMRAALQYAGITGLRFVEISGGITGSENLEPGGKILTKKGLGEKAEDIVLNIDSVVEALNNLLDVENREKISLILKNLEKSTAVISDVLEKKKGTLGNSFDNIEKVSGQLSEVVDNLKQFTLYLDDIVKKVQPEKIEKLVANTDGLIQNISQRMSKNEMGKVLDDFQTFVETATVSIRKVENRFNDIEGELSQTLVGLRESIENISAFTRQLSEDPTILLRKRAEKRSKK
ncbi:MAG: MCE family protein [bacterium]|nr:MCE family protein [bacterium]